MKMVRLERNASFSSGSPTASCSSSPRRFSSFSFRRVHNGSSFRRLLLANRRLSKRRRTSDTWNQVGVLSDQQVGQLAKDGDVDEPKRMAGGKEGSEWVRLVVGGATFVTRRQHLMCFPESRLSRLMRATESRTMLSLCDHYVPSSTSASCFESSCPTFVFDRSSRNFEMILDAYRRGTLHLDHYGCVSVVKNELDYWHLDEAILQPCCALRFQQDVELCIDDLRQAEAEEAKDLRRINNDTHNASDPPWKRFKSLLWHTLEEHNANLLARILAIVSVLVILISSTTLVLSQALSDDQLDTPMPLLHFESVGDLLVQCETFAYIYFTVEYVLRLLSAPNRVKFVLSVLNLVDVLTILPFLLALATYEHQAVYVVGKASKLLHLLRLLRIFRIFKVLRHVASLRSLLASLRASHRELRLLLVVVAIASLFFSTLIFHAEKSGSSFGDTLYFTLLTMAGFQGLRPDSLLGRAAALACSMVGVIVVTLPVPIVIRSFRAYYRHRLMKRVVELRNERRYKHLFSDSSRSRRATRAFIDVANMFSNNDINKRSSNSSNPNNLFHV